MDERVMTNTDGFSVDIENVINEIRQIRSDKTFKAIMGDEIKKIKEWEILLQSRINEPFNIVVIGDFKRGKSTFINALLGKYTVPTNALSETVTINKIKYGENNKAFAKLKNGKVAKINLEELNRNKLEEIIRELPSEIEYIEIESDNPLLKDISITDTPGIGDIFMKFDEQVAKYLLFADAIIYVVSARSPISMTEKQFLFTAALPQNFSRFFVVLNMIDTIEEIEDIEKLIKRTQEAIIDIDLNASVYPVSALDEYCRISENKRPSLEIKDYLEEKFEYLRSSLNNDIILQKDVIRTYRIANTANFMIKEILDLIGIMNKVLSSSTSEFENIEKQYSKGNIDLINNIEKEISYINLEIDEMENEAREWMYSFLKKLKGEIASLQNNVSANVLQKHFQFFMLEKIKAAIIACVTEHKKQLTETMKETAKKILNISSPSVGSFQSKIADNIVDISWTGADTAVFATEVIMTNLLNLGAISLIGKTIAGFFRQKQLGNKQKDFLEPLLANFSNIEDEIQNELKNIYKGMQKNTEISLRNFYEDQLDKSSNAINQAKILLEENKIKSEDAINYLNETVNELTDLSKVLEKYYDVYYE